MGSCRDRGHLDGVAPLVLRRAFDEPLATVEVGAAHQARKLDLVRVRVGLRLTLTLTLAPNPSQLDLAALHELGELETHDLAGGSYLLAARARVRPTACDSVRTPEEVCATIVLRVGLGFGLERALTW